MYSILVLGLAMCTWPLPDVIGQSRALILDPPVKPGDDKREELDTMVSPEVGDAPWCMDLMVGRERTGTRRDRFSNLSVDVIHHVP